MLQLTCPHCRRVLAVPPSASGQVVTCPLCGGHLTVPQQTAAFVMPEAPHRDEEEPRQRRREKGNSTPWVVLLLALIVLLLAVSLFFNFWFRIWLYGLWRRLIG